MPARGYLNRAFRMLTAHAATGGCRAVYPLLLCAGVLWSSASQAAERHLRLGIFPYLSSAELLRTHRPLAEFLAQALHQPLGLVSAPDFGEFRQRTAQSEYDIVITAPHLGVLAEREAAYQRVLMTLNRSHAVFVVAATSPWLRLEDLRDRRLALPPARAIISHLALETMAQHGLRPSQDFRVITARSHDNALQTLLYGQAEAAAFGLPTWETADPELKTRVRVVAESKSIPGFFIMARSGLPADQVAQLRQVLLQFQASAVGTAYLRDSGLLGFSDIDPAEVEALQVYVHALFQQP